MKQYLDIQTPEEYWDYMYSDRPDANRKRFDWFVKTFDVKYFIPCEYNLPDIPSDMCILFDHCVRILTGDNQYYTIAQPYKHVPITALVNKYYLCQHIAYFEGFHNKNTYLIIFSDACFEFFRTSQKFLDYDDTLRQPFIAKPDLYLHNLYMYSSQILPDKMRELGEVSDL